MLKQQISIWYQRSTDRNKWELLEPKPAMPIWVQNKKCWSAASSAALPLPLWTLQWRFFFFRRKLKKITNPSEKFSICLKPLCHQLLCFVSGAGWGDGDSQDRTRIGVWFAEILEELISFVVVCFCLSLSGTSFTDIPVYCWQLLLNKIIFSLPSRSFSYFLKISCVIQDCRVLGWPKLLVIIFSIFGLQV